MTSPATNTPDTVRWWRPFVLHPADPILGARLSIELEPGSTGVRIRYRTRPAR
jgi:hypothetical protein